MLSHFLCLWILFVYSIALTSNSTHCPVSNALNKEDGYLSYPFGIFSNLTSSREEAVVKCSHQLQRRIEQRHCPIRHSSNLCPIHEQNIRDAQSSTTWKVRPTLCSLSQSLMTSNHTVNVFVLGGSFTLGRGTRGCCCDHRLDRKCVPNACSRMREPVDASLSCRWSNFLHLFLASTFKAKVNLINLSSTAQSSDKALFENSDRLKNLTSSDIVFLDYSVNDGFYFHRPGYDKLLFSAMEHLIRFIYQHSMSPPSVILLETYPFPYGGSISKGRYAKLAHTKADYAAIYRSIAQYYSLPLWSYRDIAWSSFAEVKQSFFVDELKFSPGGYTFLHPPWYLHLFYADLLAALLVREFSTCSQKPHLSLSKHVSLTDEHKLPAALTASETNLCVNAPDALLLSVSYDHEPSQTNTTSTLPSYNVTQRTGLWEHRQDSKGRYGLISELKAGEQVKLITFGFNNSHLQLESSIHLVSIRYLRSYSHAGRFDVYLCDKFGIGLDALWKQYKTYRVSSIENAEIILNPLGRNKYSKQRFCVGERYPTISIHHFQYRDQHFKARSNLQKIKINSIKICRIDTTYLEDNF